MLRAMIAPLVFAFAAVALSAAGSAQEADVAHGQAVFRKCQACHSLEKGVDKVGPSLHGVIGRQAGTLPGYSYSRAVSDSGLIWTELVLDAYLADPRDFLPGNKMTFAGLKQQADRRDVLAY